jgi:hypothetical protein
MCVSNVSLGVVLWSAFVKASLASAWYCLGRCGLSLLRNGPWYATMFFLLRSSASFLIRTVKNPFASLNAAVSNLFPLCPSHTGSCTAIWSGCGILELYHTCAFCITVSISLDCSVGSATRTATAPGRLSCGIRVISFWA